MQRRLARGGKVSPIKPVVLRLIEAYQRSDMAVSAPISALLGAGSRTVASCMVYLFKSIPINEPFGPNTLDKDQGGQGSTPVELFTRGQRTSALLKCSPLLHYPYPTLRRAFLHVGYAQSSKTLGGGVESVTNKSETHKNH